MIDLVPMFLEYPLVYYLSSGRGCGIVGFVSFWEGHLLLSFLPSSFHLLFWRTLGPLLIQTISGIYQMYFVPQEKIARRAGTKISLLIMPQTVVNTNKWK